MMSEQVEKEVIDDGTHVQQTTRVTSTKENEQSADATNTASNVVWFIAGVLLILLAFRFVLMLLAANQENAFANFVYVLSYPFAAPFFGLFGYTIRYGVSQFELSTLVAIAVYALVAFGITRLINIRRA
jgi:uncharacterized protein YggT (Ycf19 family)